MIIFVKTFEQLVKSKDLIEQHQYNEETEQKRLYNLLDKHSPAHLDYWLKDKIESLLPKGNGK